MTVALIATAIVVVALLWEVTIPYFERRGEARRVRKAAVEAGQISAYDPGRERRAEQRAKELLKSCVNEEEWEMYRDLGLIRVWGAENLDKELRGVPYAYLDLPAQADRGLPAADRPPAQRVLRRVPGRVQAVRQLAAARTPTTSSPSGWRSRATNAASSPRANMHLPGRQVDPKQIQRDIWRLGRWERERLERTRRTQSGARVTSGIADGPQAPLSGTDRGP